VIAWALVGALAAVGVEAYMRAHVGVPYYVLAPVVLVGAAAVNYSIYQLMQAETILGATVLFTAATAICRVAASLWVQDAVTPGTWTGFGLVLAAAVVKMLWR
jgi:hypothetical protein